MKSAYPFPQNVYNTVFSEETIIIPEEWGRNITEALEDFRLIEQNVFYGIARYGHTHQVLADEYDYSPARISQLYKKVLAKLMSPNKKQILMIGKEEFMANTMAKLKTDLDELEKIKQQQIAENDRLLGENIDLCRTTLSLRCYNALSRANIFTLRDLACRTENELFNIRWLSREDINAIKKFLEGNGLTLGMRFS